MFSCRTRGFCPSCHSKRREEWGDGQNPRTLHEKVNNLSVPQSGHRILVVPQEAVLVRTGGRKLVFVEESGLAKWRYIEIGLENEHYAEILDGVKEGELVLVEGHSTLAHDAKIRVKEESE